MNWFESANPDDEPFSPSLLSSIGNADHRSSIDSVEHRIIMILSEGGVLRQSENEQRWKRMITYIFKDADESRKSSRVSTAESLAKLFSDGMGGVCVMLGGGVYAKAFVGWETPLDGCAILGKIPAALSEANSELSAPADAKIEVIEGCDDDASICLPEVRAFDVGCKDGCCCLGWAADARICASALEDISACRWGCCGGNDGGATGGGATGAG